MELREIAESFQKKKRELLTFSYEELPMKKRTEEIEITMAYEVSVESDKRGGKGHSNDILRNAEIKKEAQK